MIAIQFSPVYEDRVSIYLKQSNLKSFGITYDFKDAPTAQEEKKCFWVFKYSHPKQVALILYALKEMKEIMGIDGLQFSHCYNEKEYYCQYSQYNVPVIWFKI